MHFKRLSILLLCLIFVFTPIIDCYAAINDDILWQPLNSENELVQAFQDYCKSRDLTIEGSVADAVTTATTGTFNGLCNKLGIDITALQADIKKSTDQAGHIQWLFNSNGITAYNRIFSQFLQDNELEVGDTVSDLPIYQGYELNGNVVYVTESFVVSGSTYPNQDIIQRGSYYLYNSSNLNNYIGSTIDFTFGNTTYDYYVFKYSGETWQGWDANNILFVSTNANYSDRPYVDYCISGNLARANVWNYTYSGGHTCIYKPLDQNYFCVGVYYYRYNSLNGVTQEGITHLFDIPANDDDDINPCNVYITTNNNTINNNNYEGDTIINNYGTPDNPDNPDDPDDPIGGTPPNWDIGGGQGTADDGNGNTWNINFPDFQLPDLNIDWSINGLGNKFPFSIPFDLVALVTVLNAPPEAPRFQGTVNFGFTTWDYDINLESFDTVASACRIAELLLLVFGLIMVTRSIIKG